MEASEGTLLLHMMCACFYATEAELITQNERDHLREELQEDLWMLSSIVTSELSGEERKRLQHRRTDLVFLAVGARVEN